MRSVPRAVATGSIKFGQLISLPIEHILNRLRYAALVPQVSLTSFLRPGTLFQHSSWRICLVAFALNALRARSGRIDPIETTMCMWLVLTLRAYKCHFQKSKAQEAQEEFTLAACAFCAFLRLAFLVLSASIRVNPRLIRSSYL